LGSSGRLTGIEKASRKGKSSNGNGASEIIMGNYIGDLPQKIKKGFFRDFLYPFSKIFKIYEEVYEKKLLKLREENLIGCLTLKNCGKILQY
jgi:hypothetical protein